MKTAYIPNSNTYRIGALCIALLLLIGLTPARALATADEKENAALPDAKAYLLVEATTQQVLAASEGEVPCDVAGLSKLPAMLAVCEAVDAKKLDLGAEIAVSRRAAGISGPTAFIEAGETIQAAHLMKAAVMIGAGDAILAMGEHIYGTESAFLDAIHARLRALSIDLTLTDAVGIGTQFSPQMLAVIGAELMKSDCFRAHSTLTLETILHPDGRETELASSNRMLRSYAGCSGVMTGSSPTDGYSGVISVIRGDTHLIAVVIGCRNSSQRFELAGSLMDEAFATTRAQKLCEKGDLIREDVPVKGGRRRTVNLVAKETVVLLLEKSEPSLQAVEELPERLTAPLLPNEVLGGISYRRADGEELGRVDVIAQAEVEAFTYRDIISVLLFAFIRR